MSIPVPPAERLAIATDLTDPAAYREPLPKSCNLVMKGGITSGVIYPLAICQLATDHRIARVGGTSAGAIAAGVAAAAEKGRDSGGFAELASLPAWLSAPAPNSAHTNLYHLFQPQPITRPVHRLVAVFLARGGAMRKTLAGLAAALRLIRLRLGSTIALVLPGALLALSIVFTSVPGIVAASLLLLVGLIIAIVLSFWHRLNHDLERNLFGLCTGMPSDVDGEGPVALTPWLEEKLRSAAGCSDQRPLTFGDLDDADVTLRMFTTNVTTGAQTRLPFFSRVWAFDPDEFRRLFPANVVDHMLATAPEPPADVDPANDNSPFGRLRGAGLVPLPDEPDLPVIVGVRMSLSFPGLLSAVPLHAIDFDLDPAQPARHWFSDGGATSNFPLHFFDEAIPDRPTFGIDLRKDTRVAGDESANVSIPESNADAIAPRVAEIDGFVPFLLALLSTMQNWADNMQKHIPGYRDRIVTVTHTKTEGGLNLDMEPDVVSRLTERGQYAGAAAQQRFDIDNHRWVRFRSFLQLLEEFIGTASGNLDASESWPETRDERSYADLIDDPPSYKDCSKVANRRACEAVRVLAGEFDTLTEERNGKNFADGAPRPEPEIQIRPNI